MRKIEKTEEDAKLLSQQLTIVMSNIKWRE